MSDTERPVEIDVRHRGVVTACLMSATLMQALDQTIANVALPYMQGSLSASYDQMTWVLTSYVVMAAIMTAPVGWLSARYGRKNLFIVCLTGFTVASALCGIANSLFQIVLYRLLQGAFGAALGPLAQATMLDIYDIKQRGKAMAVFSMGVMMGPIIGPTLGGYLTADLSWRWVFYVNVPFGIATVLGLMAFMPRHEPGAKTRFDWTGFAVLAMALAALQYALDRGDELDWLNSRTIVICFVLAGLGFYLFIVHLCLARNTFVPRRVFMDRNFIAGLVTIGSLGLVLISSSSLLAPYLENLSGYPVAQAGLVMAPRGFGTLVAMQIAGRLANRVDPRILLFTGFALLTLALYMQIDWTPDVSNTWLAFTIAIQGAGLGLVFVPLQIIAFYTLPADLRTQGAAMLALVRSVGAAVGVSLTTWLLDHMTQYEHAVLASNVTPFTRALQVGGAVSHLLNPGTAAGAAVLGGLVGTQASIIAYVDDFKFMMLSTLPAFACLFLMRKPPDYEAMDLDEMHVME
jgi:MFS transporter, DHA2 family, multidrug resistance protein